MALALALGGAEAGGGRCLQTQVQVISEGRCEHLTLRPKHLSKYQAALSEPSRPPAACSVAPVAGAGCYDYFKTFSL